MALIKSTATIPSGASFELEQSLKFNDDDSAYLSWTPSSAGNRTTWTWSGWIKLGSAGDGWHMIFSAGSSSNGGSTGENLTGLLLYTDTLYIYWDSASGGTNPAMKLRDPSAWYHVCLVATSSSLACYINGTLAGTKSGSGNGAINNTLRHGIGVRGDSLTSPFDGYMSEINFIDGTAVAPSNFAETGTYGEWKPIEYSGTYGTNGFYLPFKQDYTVEGFSTVTYRGSGATQYIGGTGFQPDLVWIKNRDHSYGHHWTDSVRGAGKDLYSDTTDAEYSNANSLQAFNTDGFTLGSDNGVNTAISGRERYVAWNWDMGGSNATNTDGSITSTVRANTTYGQSIVTWTGNATAGASVGTGLSSAAELIIIKNRETAGTNWRVHDNISGKTNGRMDLNSTGAENTANHQITFQSDKWTFNSDSGQHEDWNKASTNMLAYCFHSVTGYSKFGSYTGGGGTEVTTTTGFAPAFVMVKNTNTATNWEMFDNVRNPTAPQNLKLGANLNVAENGSDLGNLTQNNLEFLSNGFKTTGNFTDTNESGSTFIYMAFADTREYAYWLDQSGNNNDWTSNNLTESDISVDSPTNNFATFNPLAYPTTHTTLSEGNLSVKDNGGDWSQAYVTQARNSGKVYVEFMMGNAGGMFFGITTETTANNPAISFNNYYVGSQTNDFGFRINDYGSGSSNNEGYSTGGSFTSLGTAQPVAGDIYQLAFDLDNAKVYFGKNNTWFNSANPSSGSNGISISATENYFVTVSIQNQNTNAMVLNAGQDSSFAGNKTAQGNQDSGGVGDFYYTPPSGFLALCTSNLPDVDVVPSEHFNTVLYTGNNATSLAITGVGFQPDFLWLKRRDSGASHYLVDAVRGRSKGLLTNGTTAEYTTSDTTRDLRSFDSDGFTVGQDYYWSVNTSGATMVAWNWKANGSGSSNTNGSINSTVSANVDAGFSIVSYTGTGSAATVGHGLSKAPDFFVTKTRNNTGDWMVYSGDATDFLKLNETNATEDLAAVWNDTSPTSSVFSLGSNGDVNTNGRTYIAYCFHSVDGYSKVGSYTGNGSTDGTFVYTGFRPAFIMVKSSSATGHWEIHDTTRDVSNVSVKRLFPNYSNAEDSDGAWDILSNGFKFRTTHSSINASGASQIYIAFAETPFKYSNAR